MRATVPTPPAAPTAPQRPASRPTQAAGAGVGPLLREWRNRRRRSQLDLALDVGVSPRHLSFIETGRARPSAAMVLALAEQLALPLRERNRLLLAAGHAPRFSQRGLDAPEMAAVRSALQRLLDAHHPYPGVVLDRHWNVLLANDAARALIHLLPPALLAPPLNMLRVSLHPQGFAAATANFAEWGGYLIDELQRAVAQGADPVLVALQQELLALPNVAALRAELAAHGGRAADEGPTLLLPCVMDLPLDGPGSAPQRVSLFTTLTAFGTPRDITLDELAVELFYPADAASQALLRAAAARASAPGA
ncbi:helix-turn-helix transcriptional regulator [Aquabacterium sp. OR-4]|uniref:helix-turn-helix transcriptional regulator n=1 Tax=Aquabacterium sp. OR-4 TaxID=2978127 RepID=UPI0021B4981F|nr:helix-turn-helix transcriptional regulator [Aquabacterium sp. OR-4]MDT7834055.1 helix-turn-helix transcriptional regulator [Aquabacterium sp. OR-4]